MAASLTAYSSGGAAEWGGRFYHLLLPIVVIPAVLGLLRFGRSLEGIARPVVALSVVVLTVTFPLLALRANLKLRELNGAIRDDSAAAAGWDDPRHASRSPDLFVIGLSAWDGTGRIFWKDVTEGRPIVTSSGLNFLPSTLRRAEKVGVDDVLVLVDLPIRTPEDVVERLAGDRWRVTATKHTRVGNYALVRLGATG